MEGDIRVLLFVESRYKVNRRRIKNTARALLIEQGVKGPAEVSVAIVGDRKMRELSKKHRGLDKTTNVLSFSLIEGEHVNLPPDVLGLGDVVISYPAVIREAAKEEVLVDDKIDELLKHGLLHLLGVHHEG